ncbi:hypothetical protein SacazDRAFT_01915 [Saccharomonospora azurea NA-128]|uniref:PE domain-containing protein n=2 Tax=Saccharomonospora azurea TaxID=40988 RepID=H8GD44_9PSEU|nr:hypothetical protein SacazDRAFT_01915 [Saccharomonospora azurea NA-128]
MAPGGAAVGASMASLWRNTNFIVDGKASAPGAGGGGFELDADTAEGLYREAADLAWELDRQVFEADRLRETRPPAEDPASIGFNNVGNQAFDSGAQHVRAEADFYRGLAFALGKALGMYQDSDDEAERDVSTSGGEADSGGGFI